jgi:Tol biopolymer transport system component
VSAINGEEHVISSPWPRISGLAALADGSGFVVSAKDQRSNSSQIWRLVSATGEPQRITNDLNDYFGISLTSDTSALVTVQSQTTSNIWIVQPGHESSAKQIITGGNSPSWTPDNKIAYHSSPTGKQDLWLSETDGSGQQQLSFDATDNRRPIVTSNNRYIVFDFFRDGVPFIARVDRDGGNLKVLTSDIGGTAPFDVSPDGVWVVYSDFTKGGIWKVPVEGGDPVPLTTDYYQRDFAPAISPDGKLIASYNRDRPDGAVRIAIHPFAGGGPIRILQIPRAKDLTQDFISPLRWTRDGRAVTYIDARDDVFNLWNQPLDGSPPEQLTHFTSDKIFWFDWSRDGKQLVLARGTIARNAILIKGN